MQPPDKKQDTVIGQVALAVLALLFLAVPLGGKALAADLAVPVMLWQLWRKREELLELLFAEGKWLFLAFAWMCLALATQFARGRGSLYDFAVFGYMAVIYFFYRVTALPSRRTCAATGGALLALCMAGWLATRIAPGAPFVSKMLYTDVHFALLAPNQLVTRYQFAFGNPNLLGSVFILPVVLMLPVLKERVSALKSWPKAILMLLACLLACIPLFATASKHLVMTFGLLAGAWTLLPLLPRRLLPILATGAVAAFGLLCLVTVLFQTYPAIQNAPWVDFHGRGNYSVHQEIYAKILLHEGLGGMLFGHSHAELTQLYPKYADTAKIAGILEPYGFGAEASLFATFMDPHQEYLNFAAFFGVPALLALLAFLLAIARRAINANHWETALFVLGILFAFCWDDLGSKRWLWAALGILAARLSNTRRGGFGLLTHDPTTPIQDLK